MRTKNYGIIGSTNISHRLFMIKAIQKIEVNNKNIIKMLEKEDGNGIKKRIINSIHLLEAMDRTLNHESEEEIVNDVSTLIKWLQIKVEELENWEANIGLTKKTIAEMNPIITDLETIFSNIKE